MFGCDSSASTFASRSSCAANGDDGEMVDLRTLRATVRPRGSSTARRTDDSEPEPSSSRTRNPSIETPSVTWQS
jgi:hypothetical protein